jgi:hypothetical protein
MTSEYSRETTVPGGWEREFALALRLQGFDGMQISDALASVEARCEAGKLTPLEAFGDPVAHAAYLRLPPARRVNRSTATVVLPVLGLTAGISLAFDAVMHWSDGVVVSAGTVAAIVVFVAAVTIVSRFYAGAITSALNLTSCVAGGIVLVMLLRQAMPQSLFSVHPAVAIGLGLLSFTLGLTVRLFPQPIADTPRL